MAFSCLRNLVLGQRITEARSQTAEHVAGNAVRTILTVDAGCEDRGAGGLVWAPLVCPYPCSSSQPAKRNVCIQRMQCSSSVHARWEGVYHI